MAFGDTAGLLFKIRSDSTDAQADLGKLKGLIAGVEGGAAALPAPLLIAAAAIAAVGTAAVTTGAALFNLAKDAAEYGSEIYDASQKTGLAAETLSALKLAADTSGSSFQSITASVGKFNVLLGEAKQGNEKASDTLKKYGITATDTNTALAQAVDVVNKLTSADQKAVAVKELFKDRTGALIPVISTMTDGLNKQIEAAKKLGITLTESDIKAADEFGDTLDTLSIQAKAMASKFALQYAPQITAAMQSITKFLGENSAGIVAWGKTVGDVITGVIKNMQIQVENAKGAIAVLAAVSRGDFAGAIQAAAFTAVKDQGIIDNPGPSATPPGAPQQAGPNPQDIEAQKKAAEEARKAREEARKKELAGLISYNQEKLKYEQSVYEAEQHYLEQSLIKSDQSLAARQEFGKKSNENLASYLRDYKAILDEGLKLDLVGKTGSEIDAAQGKYKNALASMYADGQKSSEDANKLIVDVWKKGADEQRKIDEDLYRNRVALGQATTETLIAQIDLLHKRGILSEVEYATAIGNLKLQQLEAERDITTEIERQQILDEAIKQQKLANAGAIIDATNKEVEAAKKLAESKDKEAEAQQKANDASRDAMTIYPQLTAMQAAFARVNANMADIIGNAFQGMAKAIGSVVQQWVLYGKTAPAIMRQILAQALASIAAESAVRAIFELAAGFAALFFDPGEAAAHFTAAALYGSIAVGAALTGRAIAGKSFQQQSATGTSSSASSSGQGQTHGGAFSSRPDQIIEQGINVPSQAVPTIIIQDKSGTFKEWFEVKLRNSGDLRTLIRTTANG